MDDQKSEFRHVKMLMSASRAPGAVPPGADPHPEAADSPSLERRRMTNTGLGNTKAVREVRQSGKKKIKVTFVVEGLERQLSE